jgi:hypothetical protein
MSVREIFLSALPLASFGPVENRIAVLMLPSESSNGSGIHASSSAGSADVRVF